MKLPEKVTCASGGVRGVPSGAGASWGRRARAASRSRWPRRTRRRTSSASGRCGTWRPEPWRRRALLDAEGVVSARRLDLVLNRGAFELIDPLLERDQALGELVDGVLQDRVVALGERVALVVEV